MSLCGFYQNIEIEKKDDDPVALVNNNDTISKLFQYQ